MPKNTSFVTPPPFSFLREEYQHDPVGFVKFLFKTFPITECLERIWQMECAYMVDEQIETAGEGEKKDALLFTHLCKALLEASYVMANNPPKRWMKKFKEAS